MPYKNIVFVKLQKRLLNDPKWWTMGSYSQLLYVKMLMVAADLGNKIPIDPPIFRGLVRCELPLSEFNRSLEEVLKNFPKIKRRSIGGKDFYYLSNFHEYTNYISKQEKLGKSQVIPKEALDKEKEKEKEKKKTQPFSAPPSQKKSTKGLHFQGCKCKTCI